ncbi:unnamed protein product [Closterium sp. Yama58-4]|nr:unnamed protein product [Closterium sp. Yama58-4]
MLGADNEATSFASILHVIIKKKLVPSHSMALRSVQVSCRGPCSVAALRKTRYKITRSENHDELLIYVTSLIWICA